MESLDLGVLFTYRLLVSAGFLDDDLAPEEAVSREDPVRRIGVAADLCVGCYACRPICPASAIRIWDNLAHVTNPLACLSCVETPCVSACPTSALSKRPVGPLGGA